jgi:hypothetical protein
VIINYTPSTLCRIAKGNGPPVFKDGVENIKYCGAVGVVCTPCVPSDGECAGGPSEVLLLGDPGGVAEGSLSFGFTFC